MNGHEQKDHASVTRQLRLDLDALADLVTALTERVEADAAAARMAVASLADTLRDEEVARVVGFTQIDADANALCLSFLARLRRLFTGR